jgi:hypothetical protein
MFDFGLSLARGILYSVTEPHRRLFLSMKAKLVMMNVGNWQDFPVFMVFFKPIFPPSTSAKESASTVIVSIYLRSYAN